MEREGGARGACCFWSKTAGHSAWCGKVGSPVTHHEMGKCVERGFKNFSLKLNAASHNSNRYPDTDGFLEHSPSGGSLYYKVSALQKIIPIFRGPSLYIHS